MKSLELKKGDTIAIISPAGAIKAPEKLQNAVRFWEKEGYKVDLSPNILAQCDYLAGSDDLRVADLHYAFLNSEIKAILCSRGGYGCARLLDKIDFNLIKQNPKPIFGYSDITTLLNTLPCPTFHAPMAVSDFGEEEIDSLSKESFLNTLKGLPQGTVFKATPDFATVNTGQAKGELIGGNLSVLASLLGTKFFPATAGKILLLEDLNEDLYKIDRMLTQLRLAGVFDNVAGIIFADFGETEVPIEFLKQFLPPQTPAIKGFQASHKKNKYTLPLRVEYLLDANNGTLTLL